MFAAAALLALAVGVGPVTAAAGSQKSVASKITLKLDAGVMKRLNPWTFHGRVSSKVARCERGRRVELAYRPEGGGGAEPYGEDTTNRKGRYEIVANVTPPGRYVAKVLPKKKGDLTCGGGRSEPVTVTLD
ncbi:hypothetical protein HJD18_12335 [Thermoleophilia bacterium SCSIO 60948]|nr:hypothetical protein HJD18_12335 [Thermoleophilia bacterium SCSIO 60948]